jgi:Ser/Thr protein kinase RdoA (MazF antagonist)
MEPISLVFAKYGLGEITRPPEPIQGDVDLNFKITATSGVYFLKHIINLANLQQFEFLGPLHENLREKDIPVPKIFKTLKGKYVEDSFILYEDWTDQEMVSLVHNFATLLKALQQVQVPDFIKNKNDKYIKGANIRYCYDVFKPQILALSLPNELKKDIGALIDIMYEKVTDFEKLPKSLIHGDLNEMNALFKGGENIGIIDFGISYDPTIYDLGEFCYWFCFHFGMEEFNKERFRLIVKTFEEILPLSQVERDLLPYMILRRHMMDILLALQWYWDNTNNPLPENDLQKKNMRSKKIFNAFNIL